MRLHPFDGYLVSQQWASRVVSGAYDAFTPARRRAVADANPDSYFNVTRSPDEYALDERPPDDELLAKSRAALDRLLAAGAFVRQHAPSLYVYRLTDGDHVQTGVVGEIDLDDYRSGLVRRHEAVVPDRVALLARHLDVVGATSSPVSLTYRAEATGFEDLLDAAPALTHAAADGVLQEVWRVEGPATSELAARVMPAVAYVTDGHHRLAAAAAAGVDRTLVALFPDTELRVLAFNRRVRDLGGLTPQEFLGGLEAVFDVDLGEPLGPGHRFGLYVDGRWYGLAGGAPIGEDPVQGLDAVILQERVLAPLLGIHDAVSDPRLEYLAAPIGRDELVRRCDADGGAAFVLRPTTVAELMAVADAGEVMPPKSSYFDPKPRSGVFLRLR